MAGAGRKTELIVFEREQTTRRDGGGHTSTWAEVGRAWAEVKWLSGSEKTERGALRTLTKCRFTCWAAGVDALSLTPKDRIVWNGDRYNIRERPRTTPASPEIEIVAESGVAV